MSADQLTNWISQNQENKGYWYVKRLSGNDTQATGSHQAGPYIPNRTAFQMLPELYAPDVDNPRVVLRLVSDSHDHEAVATIIWYNNRLRGGTRNEIRMTNLGGYRSPLLDAENTGAIAILLILDHPERREARYWVCRDSSEENVAEAAFGPIEPSVPWFSATSGAGVLGAAGVPSRPDCWLTLEQMPSEWREVFPTPQEVFDKAISLRSYQGEPVDSRLVSRRACEYNVFQSAEYAFEMKDLQSGFDSIDAFLSKAQRVLQRRKARSGRSLELQVRAILYEEQVPFKFQPRTEAGNRPDFVFPSQEAYDDSSHPSERLRMLAVKTTVKERWRQVLEEANRIPTKHLLTLQEGVSERQFAQMQDAGVRLVVPRTLHSKYPMPIRPQLMTVRDMLEDFRSVADQT